MDLIKKLCVPSPCGYEDELINVIKSCFKEFGITPRQDAHKNLIAHLPGNSSPVMFLAAMDTPGLLVTYIEDTGFLRFSPTGGIEGGKLSGKKVVFKSGAKGIVAGGGEISDMYIDIGALNQNDAEAFTAVSDYASIDPECFDMGNFYAGYFAGRRGIILSMINAAREMALKGRSAYFVFVSKTHHTPSVSFMKGLDVLPEFAFLIDTSKAVDTPGEKVVPVHLSGGVTLKVMDGSVISHEGAIEFIETAKDFKGLLYREVTKEPGFLKNFQTFGGGIKTATIGLPVRYKGEGYEVLHKGDLKCLGDLISSLYI